MTRAALWALSLTRHFLRIHVLLVREPLHTKLVHLGWKTYSCALCVNRRFVTYDAHLTRRIRKVLGVAIEASRMTGENWRNIVVRPLMTEAAVLRLSLVLGAIVIEWRGALDYH